MLFFITFMILVKSCFYITLQTAIIEQLINAGYLSLFVDFIAFYLFLNKS